MARMTKKARFDREDHEEWAKPLIANDTGFGLLAQLLDDSYGLGDRLVMLTLQAREACNRLRAELHRRYILQGMHENGHQSPYYPGGSRYGTAGEVEAGVPGLPRAGDEHGPERPDAGQCPGTGQPDQRPGGDAPAAAGVSGGEVRGRVELGRFRIRESALVAAGLFGWFEDGCLIQAKLDVPCGFKTLPDELLCNHYCRRELEDKLTSWHLSGGGLKESL